MTASLSVPSLDDGRGRVMAQRLAQRDGGVLLPQGDAACPSQHIPIPTRESLRRARLLDEAGRNQGASSSPSLHLTPTFTPNMPPPPLDALPEEIQLAIICHLDVSCRSAFSMWPRSLTRSRASAGPECPLANVSCSAPPSQRQLREESISPDSARPCVRVPRPILAPGTRLAGGPGLPSVGRREALALAWSEGRSSLHGIRRERE